VSRIIRKPNYDYIDSKLIMRCGCRAILFIIWHLKIYLDPVHGFVVG